MINARPLWIGSKKPTVQASSTLTGSGHAFFSRQPDPVTILALGGLFSMLRIFPFDAALFKPLIMQEGAGLFESPTPTIDLEPFYFNTTEADQCQMLIYE